MVKLMVSLNPQPMRIDSELAQGYLKRVHPLVKCVMGSKDESIPHNDEVFNIEGHL
jgi:type IV secretory pathway protease TraF